MSASRHSGTRALQGRGPSPSGDASAAGDNGTTNTKAPEHAGGAAPAELTVRLLVTGDRNPESR